MALIYDVAFNSQTRTLSLLDKAGNVISSCEVPSKSNELTLTATADNSSVMLKKSGTLSNTYEVNTGSGWQSYTFGTVINLNNGQSCKWRCSAHPTTQSSSNHIQFVMTGTIEASGNCNSMLSSDFENITSLSGYNYAFCYLFQGCTSLTKAPDLPATTLAAYCYTYMFGACTALTKAPNLPAITLSSYCYQGIFHSCTSLTKAPDLPATTLAAYCYNLMFYNCSSLAEVHIAATTTASNALTNWLANVAATGDFYCDPNATIFPSGISGIPERWNCWLYGVEDTGTTTTMYHNGATETVRVGTSSYGTCYSAQGWSGFRLWADMHTLGYTLGAQTPLTMYFYDSPVSAYSCAANVEDGFTETMYDVGDGNGYLTMAQQNANGYHLTSKPFTGLILTATADNSSVQLTKNGSSSNTYKVNTGNGWADYTFGTIINLNNGESAKWVCSAHPTTQSSSNYAQFVMTGAIEATGNINSMLSLDFENITSYASGTSPNSYDYGFFKLFYNCSALTRADIIPTFESRVDIDAHGLLSTLFAGCTNLTSVSSLPNVHICVRRRSIGGWIDYPGYIFNAMFENCSSLRTIGSFNVLSDAFNNYYEGGRSIYNGMFRGCVSLESIDITGSLRGYDYCCKEMFKGCSSLSSISQSSFEVNQLTSYFKSNSHSYAPAEFAQSMFEGCTSLQDASCMYVSSRSSYGCRSMFLNCTSLTNPPSNIDCASQVYLSWYKNGSSTGKYVNCIDPLSTAFKGCTLLNTVNVASPPYATNTDWLDGCPATGSIFTNPTATWSSGVSGIPVGWGRFIYNATDTGNTATMYHNGSTETVRVGSYSGGSCYSAQGWAGFKTLAQMHEAGYTFGAQTPLTMYNYDSPVSAYSCAANNDDGFTETMYDVGDGKGYLTIVQQNTNGFYLASTPYTGLTFTATADNSSVKLNQNGKLSNTYKVNVGSGWAAYTFGTVINLNNGERCRWRCSAHPTTQSASNFVQFVMTGAIEATGNVNSMLSSNFESLNLLSDFAFYSLFDGCASLMRAPELPAMGLASQCYYAMFNGCTALAQTPQLPAVSLIAYCYLGMFAGCTSLTEVRIAATNISATNCLMDWLSNVSATGDFYCDPNVNFPSGASGIPSGWTRHALADYPTNP